MASNSLANRGVENDKRGGLKLAGANMMHVSGWGATGGSKYVQSYTRLGHRIKCSNPYKNLEKKTNQNQCQDFEHR